MRRWLQKQLARRPSLYLRLLRLAGRGSVEKKVFLALLRTGDVVFDVGANEGYFTLLASDLVGTRGAVHAFEPVPPTFDRLRARLEREGRFDNIRLNPFACADKPGEVELQVPAGDFGQASLRPHHDGSWRAAASVVSFTARAVRLDDYAAEQSLAQLDFVKCDIEGAELPALRGFVATLTRHHPMLLFEAAAAWTESFGYTPADLIAFLEQRGYSDFFVLGEAVVRAPDIRAKLAGPLRETSANVLCATPAHATRLARLAGL